MTTLLVAIDNTDVSRNVLSLAAEQARALKAQIMVLCCIDPAYATGGEPLDIIAGEDPADFGAALDEQNMAERVIRHALAQLPGAGIEARGRIVAGEAAEVIVAQAAALDARMIIMGRRHLSPFNRLLKGSVSAAVIERAHCPVLVDVRAQ